MTITSASPGGASRGAEAPGRPDRSWARTGLALLVVLTAALLVRAWVVAPLQVETGSMTPTIPAGSHVLVWKLGVHGDDVDRGDVVTFERRGRVWVKRVVALAGDRVGLRDGRLVVNRHVVDEPWSDPLLIDSVYFGPVVVPESTVFVLGDQRFGSKDSRVFGPVPVADVDGRVVATIWPLTDAGGMS